MSHSAGEPGEHHEATSLPSDSQARFVVRWGGFPSKAGCTLATDRQRARHTPRRCTDTGTHPYPSAKAWQYSPSGIAAMLLHTRSLLINYLPLVNEERALRPALCTVGVPQAPAPSGTQPRGARTTGDVVPRVSPTLAGPGRRGHGLETPWWSSVPRRKAAPHALQPAPWEEKQQGHGGEGLGMDTPAWSQLFHRTLDFSRGTSSSAGVAPPLLPHTTAATHSELNIKFIA